MAYGRGRVGIPLEVAVQWNKIGRALAGVADQLGIEVPGVDVGPVTDAVGGWPKPPQVQVPKSPRRPRESSTVSRSR
ncbi:MAG: hypothetical protein WCF36_05225 [Candidatus Nanopelagicales bacterium]